MRTRERATSCLIPLLVALGGLGCSGEASQLMLVIESDMEMPKDIDRIRIEVTSAGIPRYKQLHENLGTGAGLLFPATLGIVASEDRPNEPVTIQVSAGTLGGWKILREVVTTIPEGRLTMLRVPLQFLCNGSARGGTTADDVEVESGCGAGETCVAGRCEASEVAGETLPEYSEPAIFGGGTVEGDGICLEVAGCFEESEYVTPDPQTCTVDSTWDLLETNVALLTETEGMCVGTQCFVALDAEDTAGWRASAGKIQLPASVCNPSLFARPQGVVLARTSDSCPRKTTSVPTCGPWSRIRAFQARPQSSRLAVVAASQAYPMSLAVTTGPDGLDRVVWVNQGTFDKTELSKKVNLAAVKYRIEGDETVHELYREDGESAPRQVSIDGQEVYWTVNHGTQGGEVRRATLPLASVVGGVSSELVPLPPDAPRSLHAFEGIAAATSTGGQPHVLWVESGSGNMFMNTGATTTVHLDAGGYHTSYPYRVHASKQAACWTYHGATIRDGSGHGTGYVNCMRLAPDAEIRSPGDKQFGPRAVAVHEGLVFWANFNENTIRRETVDTHEGNSTALVEGQTGLNGIAVDESYVYWTNREEGTVSRARWKDQNPPLAPEELVNGQHRPGDIRVTDRYVYWVNEGSIYAPNGAIMRYEKEQ